MARYRKKPVVIEARQLTSDNIEELADWIMDNVLATVQPDADVSATLSGADAHLAIYTLEGTMRAEVGDWIIRGVQGEFYPCKPDIFASTYDPVGMDSPSDNHEESTMSPEENPNEPGLTHQPPGQAHTEGEGEAKPDETPDGEQQPQDPPGEWPAGTHEDQEGKQVLSEGGEAQ